LPNKASALFRSPNSLLLKPQSKIFSHYELLGSLTRVPTFLCLEEYF
jgi:hypothetical protein